MKSLEAATLALVDGVRARLADGVLPPAGYSQKISSNEPVIVADTITWLRSGVLAPASQFPKVPDAFQILGASNRANATALAVAGTIITSAASYKNLGAYCTNGGQVYYTTDGGDTFQRLNGRTATRVYEANGYFYFSGSTATCFRTADFVTIDALTIPGLSTAVLEGVVYMDGGYRAVSGVSTVTDYVSDDGITFATATSPLAASPTGLVTNGRFIARISSSNAMGPHISTGKGAWEASRLTPFETTQYTMYALVRVGDYIMVVTNLGNYASIDGKQWEFWGSLPGPVDNTYRPISSSQKGLTAVKLSSGLGVALTNNGRSWYVAQSTAVQRVPLVIGDYLIMFEQGTSATSAPRYKPTKMVGHPVYSDNTYYRVS